jgi:hypothetical protein
MYSPNWMTRDEGINWLRERGQFAVARQWGYALDRVADGIFASKAPVDDGEIRVLPNALILYPVGDTWVVDCTRHPIGQYSGPVLIKEFTSLEDALLCAERWIDHPVLSGKWIVDGNSV